MDFSVGGNADFGIWSLRFSADCREVIAGTSNNNLYVYNVLNLFSFFSYIVLKIERKDVEKYKGHKNEV